MSFRFIVIQLLLLALASGAYAQVLRGNIKDPEGNPIPYATVYLKEIRQGTVSNTRGDYEIRVPEGRYTVIYQSLGYTPEVRDLTIARTTQTINITLHLQYYQIPEIRITATGEDPAYGIMRKVIGLAPYYLNHVSNYKADVYLKGTLVVNKIPKLLQRSMKAEVRNSRGASASSTTIREGETYLMESFNEIEFTAPDKYVQRVISLQNTFPEQGNQISPMDFIQASFYQPVIANMAISPLSPDAFSHYKFKYSGSSAQGEYIINKIQVIPKRKSQQLFEGTIYIVEDLWCLHSIDLLNENIAGKVRVQQLYIPVNDDIWMPVSHKFDMNISIIGVKADAGYGSSIKYKEVIVNPSLKKPELLTGSFLLRPQVQTTKPDSSATKNRDEMEKLLSKGELSNRDMVKLSRLLERESKNSTPDSVRKSLEVKDRTTFIIEKDAVKKDSAFWAEIRPVPLSENERQSLKLAGSINASLAGSKKSSDTLSTAAPAQKKSSTSAFVRGIAFGNTWSDTLGFSFTFDGLMNLKSVSFNPVDGFVYATGFRIGKRWAGSNVLNIYPEILYAFSRESLMWSLNGQYRFDRMKQSQVYWRSGMTSRDIGSAGSVNTLLNSITSLLMKRNYIRLYESRYVTAGLRREVTNGLYIDISGRYDDRRVLQNSTEFSLIKTSRLYSPNKPVNYYLDLPYTPPVYELTDNRHYEAVASLQWTPWQKYRIRNNVKIPAGSDYPTFTLTYRHIINRFPSGDPSVKHYDHLRFEVSQSKETGPFGEFRWRLRAGGYIDKTSLSFFDFNHFNAQPLPVLINSYEDAFRLRDYYSLSTPELFTELHIRYTTPYLLVKLLPMFSYSLMRENLSLSFLWAERKKAYTELGYSLSELFLLGEAGLYAGFDNLAFRSAGIRFVIRLN